MLSASLCLSLFQDQRINRVVRMQTNSANRDRRSVEPSISQQDSLSERSEIDLDPGNNPKYGIRFPCSSEGTDFSVEAMDQPRPNDRRLERTAEIVLGQAKTRRVLSSSIPDRIPYVASLRMEVITVSCIYCSW